MRFGHPEFLWLLPVVPAALALFFWWGERTRQKLLTQFIAARLLPALTAGISKTRRKWRFLFIILAVAFLIVALARPQGGFEMEEVEQAGLDIVVAVDTSKSMLATDIAPNRLARAKLAALELMQRAGTDRLGLVAFAGDAFLECPLTIDSTAFQQSVSALDVKTIPQGGTALAAAINTALTAFKEKGHHKALVLLTDGEDNDAGAIEAAQNAAREGLKIFTIGIGSKEGELLDPDLVRDEQGNAVKSHLNEPLLQQIATETDGFYLLLRGADTIDMLYERGLAPLPKSAGAEKLVRHYHELFQWPLAAAILLLTGEMFLPERKREKKSPAGRAAAKTAVLTMVFCALPSLIFASPATALRDYQSGNFTNALMEYSRLAEIKTNDLRLVFNAGAAAYRATNYDAAAKDFSEATLSPDLKLQQQAFYNLGNTQYRQGELKFAPNMEGLDAMEAGWKLALQSFSRAAQLNTNDVDAAFNRKFVNRQLEAIAQLRELMRQAKSSADEAVRRAQFHRALEIMEQLTQNKIAAKPFEDYTKKLKDIDAITTPNPGRP
jgi:Ca-activated chloride channel family protein